MKRVRRKFVDLEIPPFGKYCFYVCSSYIITLFKKKWNLISEEEKRREGVPKRVIIHGHPPNQDNNNNGRLIILPDSIQLLFDLAGQFHSFTTYVTIFIFWYMLIYQSVERIYKNDNQFMVV